MRRGSENVPAATGYSYLGLSDITLDDVSRAKIQEQTDYAADTNMWLEERYSVTVDKGILNQWAEDHDVVKMLPDLSRSRHPDKRAEENALAVRVETHSRREIHEMASWNQPNGYRIKTFTNSMLGTREELEKDRAYIGRYNLAMHIQREAEREYEDRRREISRWYSSHVRANLEYLAVQAALEHMRLESGGRRRDEIVHFAGALDEKWYLTLSGVTLGSHSGVGSHYQCAINDTRASWKARFTPETADDLATLCGVEKTSLPDVLQHWSRETRSPGNQILNRIDPVQWAVRNPWEKLPLIVDLNLSKRALNKLVKTLEKR